MNELALFAGAGGGILGGHLLGWRTVCAVERERYARDVLLARQNDRILEPFPVWDDVCTFDGRPWRGLVDVVSGGFPCVDISPAGKGKGIAGPKSGLWKEMVRIVREVGPRFVFVENSEALRKRGLEVVLCDLAEMGFDARWGVLGASAAGYPHHRGRCWIVANTKRSEVRGESFCRALRRVGWKLQSVSWDKAWVDVFTEARRDVDGVANGVDRANAVRNGQVPEVARLAWEILSNE